MPETSCGRFLLKTKERPHPILRASMIFKLQKPRTARRALMKNRLSLLCSLALIACSLVASPAQQKEKKMDAAAQQQSSAASSQGTLTRTTSRHETRRMGYGGALTIVGAPAGSITIEGWSRNEVDITAEIEQRADTEEELTQLAAVNSFMIDDTPNHVRVITTGTHDKAFMRRAAKNFPKKLAGLPWKIDYKIRVPAMCDVEIDAGRGALKLSGVEGAIRITALEGDATLGLTGGLVIATIGRGNVKVNLASRSWRGAGADIRLATGEMTVELPAGFSADINADVLRTGQIENTYTTLEPIERNSITPRSINGRAGAGGAALKFTVTDGTIRIKPQKTEDGT
jgi:hypothetical protein